MNIYKFVISLFILILLVVFCIPISMAQDGGEKGKTPTQKTTGEEQKQTDQNTKFTRDLHPCDSHKGEGNAILGFLQYNLDCVPWHNDKILDLQGNSKWSIVSWLIRLISVFYRLAFVMTVIAIFIAGSKYIKAGGQGGFEVAKDALKFALIGFVVTSTSWAIMTMFMRAMTMLSGGSLFVQTYFLKDTLVGCFVIFLQMEGKIVSHK